MHRPCLTGEKTLQNPRETGPEPDRTLQETGLKTEVSDGADAGGKANHPRPGSLERAQNAMNTTCCGTLSYDLRSRPAGLPPLDALRFFQRGFFCPIRTANSDNASTREGPCRRRPEAGRRPDQTKSCARRFKSRYRPRRSAMGGVLANLVRAGRQQPQRDLLRVVVRSPPHPHFRRPAPAHCPFSHRAG